MFDHAKGSQIVWKEDKDLTKEIEIKKQRNKSAFSSRSTPIHSFDLHIALRLAHLPPSPPPLPHLCNHSNNPYLDTNRTRLVRKAVPVDSFFNFFEPPQPASDEDIENGKYDEDELEELENRLELDYQIGEDFKEKVRHVCLVIYWRLVAKANRGPDYPVCACVDGAETETLAVASRSFPMQSTTLLARRCNMN